MADKYLISGRDYYRLQDMFRWWEFHKNDRPIPQRRNIAVPVSANIIKIFKVQSEAAGDGVYNCYEQSLDATEWDDTTGDPKFDDLNTTSVEVLNFAEHKPEAEYVAQLSSGDLLAAWRKPDDEGNSRWVGVPFRQSTAAGHIAFCDGAPTGKTISAFLDKDTTGTAITVYTMMAQTGEMPNNTVNLDDASPRLTDGDPIKISKVRFWDGSEVRDYWVCDTIFQPVLQPCVCTPP